MGFAVLAKAAGFYGRPLHPRCATRECDGSAEWSGALRVWASGADRNGPPLVEVRFPQVCSPCTVTHVRNYVASDAFWTLVADMARAGMLPTPDRASIESEFTPL